MYVVFTFIYKEFNIFEALSLYHLKVCSTAPLVFLGLNVLIFDPEF